MSVHLGYRSRLAIVVFVPIFFFLIQSVLTVRGILEARVILREMSSNVDFLSANSAYIREIQVERGKSGLALSGGLAREEVTAQRMKTDASWQHLQKVVTLAVLRGNAVELSERIHKDLVASRALFNASEDAAKVVASYTATIRGGLSFSGMAAESRTTKGLGKRMTSLMLMEEARESAGLLRATLSRSVASPEGVTITSRLLLARTVYTVEANLNSPASTLSAEAAAELDTVRKGELWRQINTVAATVITGEGAAGITGKECFDLTTRMVDAIGGVIALEQKALVEEAARYIVDGDREILLTTSLLAVAFVGAAILGFLVIRGMSRSLQGIREVCSTMAQGDLQCRVVVNGDDDIANTGHEINRMIDQLCEKQRTTEILAEGNFSVEVPVLSERDALGVAMRIMVNEVGATLRKTKTAVEEVSSRAAQVSDASQSLSQGATESAASLEEISASATEIGQQARSNADTAAEANTLTSQAKRAAEKGSERMTSLNSSMLAITESSAQIAKIIKTIDDIAFQTNILALNAAVEAARAGRHGKGFAVVAEEVRSLAARSAKAARETAALIEGSMGRVEDGNRIARETAESLSEIVLGIVKVGELVGEMAIASNEQARGISEISQGLSQIDQVTQQNTATAEETASAAEELSAQSAELRSLVGQFTLKDQPCTGEGTERPLRSEGTLPSSRRGPAQGPQKALTSPAGWGGSANSELLQWSSEFSVGNQKLDSQHQQLMKLVNSLYSAMRSGKANSVVSTILDELIEYTATHFSDEENMMRLYKYPGLSDQLAMHKSLVEQALELREQFRAGQPLGTKVFNFLKSWLINHIQNEDRKYSRYMPK